MDYLDELYLQIAKTLYVKLKNDMDEDEEVVTIYRNSPSLINIPSDHFQDVLEKLEHVENVIEVLSVRSSANGSFLDIKVNILGLRNLLDYLQNKIKKEKEEYPKSETAYGNKCSI